MIERVRYTNEFLKKYNELAPGQRQMVEGAIRSIISSNRPEDISHHLERSVYFCSWSHRVRANLLIIFRKSKKAITFISTGTHAQAYTPTTDLH